MKKFFVLFAGLAAVAGLYALDLGGIAGHVYDAETRAPIPDATVCCYVAFSHTDSTGTYLIGELRAGRYKVRAFATGFETGYYPESVDVVEGQVTHSINFFLARNGSQHGAISGQVRSSRTGEVIVGATVLATNGHASRTVSQGPDGYMVGNLPPGRYWVSAGASGFEPGHYPESVHVVAGQTTTNICFHLTPVGGGTGGISGWVFDATTRQPIEGALVCAGTGPVRTGRDGSYLIDSLLPRRYQVRCEAAGYEPAVYPESVTVVGGQVTPDVNFHLQPLAQQYGAIIGLVQDRSNRQLIEGAVVTASRGHFRRSVIQTRDGYRIGELPAGRYWVSATAREYEPGCYPESVLVEVGQTTEYVDILLAPTGGRTGGIAGLVVNARTREPLLGALVIAEGPGRGHANTVRGGAYAIRELEPGRYQVVAAAHGFARSAPVAVEVVAGRITPDVNFALSPEPGGTGFIAGVVRDSATGEGITGAQVLAWGRAGQGGTQTGERGAYLLAELRAGDYRVRAGARGYYHRVFPRSVSVVEGETTFDVNFHLPAVQGAAGGVSGFVIDGIDGVELSGARVTLVGETGSFDAYSDEFGDYVVDGLEPGVYEIEAAAEGYTFEPYFEPLIVESGIISSFTCPALYPFTGVSEEPTGAARNGNPDISVQSPVRGGLARLQVGGQFTRGSVTVNVLDVSGRTLQTATCELQPAIPLDLGSLPTGIYVVTLKQGSLKATQKLVVQR